MQCRGNILVVGGAGYIGSYMCKYLYRKGYRPVVLDNLIRGNAQTVKWGPFIEGSMSDIKVLEHIFAEYEISAVMHFAAFAYVGESIKDPCLYYQNNVSASLTLLKTMLKNGISNFIFSSTCAIYGEPDEIPITEDNSKNPINPYGKSKLMVENILEDFSKAYGLKYISLRYFNASGADPEGELGEDHKPETHLIPLVLETALGKRKEIQIFGDNYPTKDGTCVRDYVHIHDLAQAHFLAFERLQQGLTTGCYNLGNGTGYTVMEVIREARNITKEPIPCRIIARRPGDPAVLVGSRERAIKDLGWEPRYPDIFPIIKTAWEWCKDHPDGYG